ncbi:MAG: 2-oxoacid:acceptor oxidoreductase family protein [Dehalococcoides mccartyi]|jgi:2-oxoacid:acceptor oxidoreductase, gamma subunit, pyruvate/2-ketoisovalerate family|uniref:2-oxoacid:acceptor oxidoreductase family protein n=3 Tax=root TaxID=1 RepID=A0A0V8M407_9CHLR|nr:MULTISPECIES: 2-oxoacid:acceptor oxidoreductase family protein [Dehalococcoides]AAW40022.1 pyruvic-ferredoxin oxidoreductase, gamma subunit [Dehalococcoides mccartyi 195]AQU03063.1 pyruvate synthase [Dehalococcoides mccartyi]AQU04380.1 pyruvate synthase [Dehalococcoides mccartyi]KSV18517.1 pyruvate synthase [Dehalococcoides mccartyi]MBF4482840.1 2-oxoacid:acceptor oxidoreductase family protein [Dehalococcoides mccartyi]
MKHFIEIRWHGRGGQGAVTSAELIAQAAIGKGKYAQAFPSFGPERRGAPVQSFNRISDDKPIRERSGISEPDIVVVLDPSLVIIGNVISGLKEGGTLIINTTKPLDYFVSEYGDRWKIATVDATAIAKELLGVNIVNTTMLGALIKATGLAGIEDFEEPLKHRFGKLAAKNMAAMKKALEETAVKELKVG